MIYAIKKADGGVAIMRTVRTANPHDEIAKMTPEMRAAYATPLVVRAIAEAHIPADREYRDAWEAAGTEIRHNMAKAQAIHMDRIRPVRDAELVKLDRLQLAAFGKGDQAEVARIETEKQKLRDIPQTFDLSGAKTTDELKALWPAGLRQLGPLASEQSPRLR